MSHVNVRFFPRVEEVEPRLALHVTTTWRALVQEAKILNQSYRAEAAYVASFTDPYCTGHLPGACSWPDVSQLRPELQDRADSIGAYNRQMEGAIGQWDVELRHLVRQHGSVSEIIHAKLEIAYYETARDYASEFRGEVLGTLRQDDGHLQASTESLWFLRTDSMKGYLDTAKNAHKQMNDYIDVRLNERSVYSAEKTLARLEGKQDTADFIVEQFMHLVQ
jgi:hypothetical protein